MTLLNLPQTKQERKHFKALRRLEKESRQPPQQVIVGDTNLEKITVLCVKFGTKYGREYIERLRNMVSRHLTVPYEFVCITDDQHPIPGVRSIVQPMKNYKKIWWHKVHMFDPSLPIQGRILYFDLDVIIHANIDSLAIGHGHSFLGIKDFNRKFHASWTYLNSSVMSWIHGSQTHIYQEFNNNPNEAQKLQGDQDWIWKTSKDRIKFWPIEWIQSYKWEIRSREELVLKDGKRNFKSVINPKIPINCSVCVFHGDPNPHDVLDPYVVDNWR